MPPLEDRDSTVQSNSAGCLGVFGSFYNIAGATTIAIQAH